MKKILLPLIIFSFTLLSYNASSQTKAVTETGDEVILYSNHTWKYSNEFKSEKSFIKSNGAIFTKDKGATFLLKSNHVHLGFWLDPKAWAFEKATNNADAEYELTKRNSSLNAVIITEKAGIPLESLRDVVVENAKSVAPDYEIQNQEYRMVNGLKVLYLQASGTVSGIRFAFYGYYFSDSTSSMQFVVTGFAATQKEDQKQAENLLNGIVVLKAQSKDKEMATSDSVVQGSLSSNHNCKRFFAGKWNYTAANQKIYVERTLTKTIEYLDKYTFEYDNVWINDCEYDLIFKKTTMPSYNLEKPGEKIHVNILTIDKDIMRYTSTFRGRNINGEMYRETKQ